MPRSGWLAIGAVTAATIGSRVGIVDFGASRVAIVALILLAFGPWAGAPRRGPVVAAGIGALAIAIRLAFVPVPAPPPATIDGDGPWEAVVVSIGSPRDGHQVGMLEVDLGASPGIAGSTVLLAATLPRYPAIEPDDRLEVGGRTRPRPDSDYGRYLERIGAWGSIQVDTMHDLAGVDEGPGRVLERLRRGAGDALAIVLPEPEAGLAAGILIGLRDRVDRTLAADFTTAGVSHVVAISGWNIAIVAAVIGAMTGRVGRRRRAVVTTAAVIAYVVFAGASPSVLRAGVMAGVVLLARESGRAGRAAAALGWAVAILLLADPALVADAGFQLSSLATAGLIAWATPLTGWFERRSSGRLPRWLAESLGVSFAAQAATLPVVLAAFGRLAMISPAVNLLIVPIVAPAMAVGVIALVGGLLVMAGAPPMVGAILALPGWVALRLMVGIVNTAAGVPGASVDIDPGARMAVGAATFLTLAGLVVWRRRAGARPAGAIPTALKAVQPATARKRGTARGSDATAGTGRAWRVVTIVLAGTMAVTAAVAISRPVGVPRITVLDVGQGDAILVEGGQGGRLLIDGGPDPDRLLIELDRLIPPWDRRIDAVVLSHPHEDHVAGLALLLDRYRVRRVFEPGMRGPGPGYAAWQDRLALDGAPTRAGLAAGDRLTVDAVDLLVLWPIRGEVPREPPDNGTGINNVSIVVLGTVGARRFLLTGDVEDGVDPRLLAEGLPRVDLLKIAHHGSRTATTDAFVQAVAPRVAIASAGAGNPYGHPARPTLDRLAAAGAHVYRTDVDGSVSVTFGANGLEVTTHPRRAASLPATPTDAVAARTATAPEPDDVPAGQARRGTTTTRAFWCAIPLGPGPAPRPQTVPTATTVAAHPPLIDGRPTAVRYHRSDDRPFPGGGREPARLPGSPDLVPRARMRGSGRGRLPCGPRSRQRDPVGPWRRRDCGAAPRCRQVAANGRSRPRPPPWRGLRSVAHEARPGRTGAPCGQPPGHSPRGRADVSHVGRLRVA